MEVAEALRAVATHAGLVRYFGEPDEAPSCRVMMRLPWSHDDRVVATNPLGDEDPVEVMLVTVEEALAEVEVARSRRGLHLVEQ